MDPWLVSLTPFPVVCLCYPFFGGDESSYSLLYDLWTCDWQLASTVTAIKKLIRVQLRRNEVKLASGHAVHVADVADSKGKNTQKNMFDFMCQFLSSPAEARMENDEEFVEDEESPASSSGADADAATIDAAGGGGGVQVTPIKGSGLSGEATTSVQPFTTPRIQISGARDFFHHISLDFPCIFCGVTHVLPVLH
jgi:hypothetical protein